MKQLLIASLAFLCSCTDSPSLHQLSSDGDREATCIKVSDNSIFLPTRFPLPDSLYIQDKTIIATKDSFLTPKDSLYGLPPIFRAGDIICRAGDTIHVEKEKIIYTTELKVKECTVFLISAHPLQRCQINIDYDKPSIYNTTLHRLTDTSKKGLDFKGIIDNRYVYSAPLQRWESGGYNHLTTLTVIFNEDDTFSSRTSNEVSFHKSDVDNYLQSFKAHLQAAP